MTRTLGLLLAVFALGCRGKAPDLADVAECRQNSGPVCGEDGVTYADDCARARHKAVVAHGGVCAKTSPSCPNTCAIGSSRCLGATSVAVCALKDGCGAWDAPAFCAGGCDAFTGRCRGDTGASAGPVKAIGEPCDKEGTCGPGRRCLRALGDLRFPQGFCSADCGRLGTCPDGATCLDVARGTTVCATRCTVGGGGCRDGYVCESDGAGGGFCAPPCTEAACAALGQACDAESGRCTSCGRAGEACCPDAEGGAPACSAGTCNAGRCG